jgi:insulysin
MGSAKFPGENEYSDHLSKSHGWSNAYTSTHQTVYFFECAHSGFDGALDRFSQFFVSPLFNANCVEREIKAVDSEHQKNLQNDGRRLYQLGKSLAKEDHPFHKFGTGSLDTLWVKPKAVGVDIRSELIKFYEEQLVCLEFRCGAV